MAKTNTKVLVVTDKPVWRLASGTRTSFLSRLFWLRDNYNFHIFYTGRPAPSDDIQIAKSGLGSVIYQAGKLWPLIKTATIEPHLDRYPKSLHKGYINPDLLKLFYLFLKKMPRYDVIILEYLYSTYMLDALEYRALRIVDTHDMFSRRLYRYKTIFEPIQLTCEEEGELFDRFDAALMIEQGEYEAARSICKRAVPLYCSCIFTPIPAGPLSSGAQFGFIGSGNPCNCEGLSWFMDEVWPFQRNPEARLHIYGEVCGHFNNLPNNVIIHGIVSDPKEAYMQCNVMINPVITGTGIKVKTLEAMAYGRPMITTPEGARGIVGNSGIWIATSRHEFVKAILRLGADSLLREEMSAQGPAAIERDFAPNKVMGPLKRLIKYYVCDN